METEEEAWPSTDLGNDKRGRESHPACEPFCGLDTLYLPQPACVLAPWCAEYSLIEVDFSIISLIKFFHFLSFPSSCLLRVVKQPSSSLLSSGGTSQLLLSPSLLIIVSITHPSPVSALAPFSSYLIPNCSIHSTQLGFISRFSFQREVGGICRMPFPHLSISPGCHQDFTDVL